MAIVGTRMKIMAAKTVLMCPTAETSVALVMVVFNAVGYLTFLSGRG